jgi:hypothetical protein
LKSENEQLRSYLLAKSVPETDSPTTDEYKNALEIERTQLERESLKLDQLLTGNMTFEEMHEAAKYEFPKH